MTKQKRRGNQKPRYLTLPELDQSKSSVLNTLAAGSLDTGTGRAWWASRPSCPLAPRSRSRRSMAG
jgi:hypothetical protein